MMALPVIFPMIFIVCASAWLWNIAVMHSYNFITVQTLLLGYRRSFLWNMRWYCTCACIHENNAILLPLEIHRFPVVYYTPRISKYFLLKFPTFICLVITILTPYIYACHYYTHPFSFSHCPKNITTTACRYAQSRPLPFFDSLTNDTISSKGLLLTASSPTHNYLPQKRKRHHITRRTNTIYITIHEREKKNLIGSATANFARSSAKNEPQDRLEPA